MIHKKRCSRYTSMIQDVQNRGKSEHRSGMYDLYMSIGAELLTKKLDILNHRI
ncbi:hypothetical protein [Listeria booriae]|uniref:hypothetical protein n=1 Tax=Listeria booriae TaxID=1552123 RepID=UPI00131EDA36|nr:hypothetical protein [Listeria booriae]